MSSDKRHPSVQVEFDGQVITPEPRTTEDGDQLLEDLIAYCRKYVRLNEDEYAVWATWVLHCHAFPLLECKVFTRTSYLHITSPTEGCGKTQLMDITEPVVPEPIKLASCTSSVLARAIETFTPVMLFDEIDKVLAGNKDLREAIMPIINSGYKKGGYRLVNEPQKGGTWVPRKLSTFCPKMLAGISSLPPDTLSRCIPISMELMLPNDRVEEIDEYITEPEAQKLYTRAHKWAEQNKKQLRDSRPVAPASLGHRQREISRPLFAVGDVVGGEWPERIRLTMVRMFANRNAAPAANVKVELLECIKQVFDSRDHDRISSADLVHALVNMEDQPWPTWSKGRPMTQNKLAKLLEDFKIYPKNVRIGDSVLKGYLKEWFEPVWERYIPHTRLQTATTPQPAYLQDETQISNRYKNEDVAVSKCEKPASLPDCSGVAVQGRDRGVPLTCPGCKGSFGAEYLAGHQMECRLFKALGSGPLTQ